MDIQYLSHSCFLINSDKSRILIDPFLSGNPKAPIQASEVECDYILISHGHNDHFGDAIEIAKANDAVIVSNYEIAMYCIGQGAKAHPMHIGGANEFPFGRVKLTIAHHGSAYEKDGEMLYMGNPAGLLITVEGKTIYHAGDTGLFLDMQLIGSQNQIDLAILPIGDNFTMGIEDAVVALDFLKPKLAVPMHYGTFDMIDVDPVRFQSEARSKGFTVQIPDIGASLSV